VGIVIDAPRGQIKNVVHELVLAHDVFHAKEIALLHGLQCVTHIDM
jgi:hypothetical protein